MAHRKLICCIVVVAALALPALAQAPPEAVIESISPSAGSFSGGTVVTIRGTNLVGPCPPFECPSVQVGFGVWLAQVISATDEELVVRTPPHRVGAVDVVVVPRSGPIAVARGGYVFLSPFMEELIMLPVVVEERAGANLSRWGSTLAFANHSNTTMTLIPYEVSIAPGQSLYNPPALMVRTEDPNPGRLFFLQRDIEDFHSTHLRFQDFSRQGENWGVEMPVVREEDFRVGPLALIDVPVDGDFRVALRIYAVPAEPNAPLQFRVRIASMSGEDTIVDTVVAVAPESETIDGYPTRPMIYQNFDLLASFPELAGRGRVEILIEPFSFQPVVPAARLFWAFASITHNQSQVVSLVTPE